MKLTPIYLGAALAFTGQAQAASYFLDQTNINQAPFTDGTNYLTVITETSGDDITFNVDALNGPGGPFAGNELSNFGIQAFGFNVVNAGPSPGSGNISNLPSGWTVDINSQLNGFGEFDVVVSGTGSNRQEPLTFSITGITGDTPASYHGPSGGNAGEGNAWYAAHVTDFSGPGETTSGFFGGGNGPGTAPAPVPLPTAVWLLGSAIASLGLISRRSGKA
ncbi:VPLPA-CTERM sorting domain-containing protein [Methylocaldum sp.]|uniref:VPLPA-CTERM sorting domain-containing protein n=1 Tax=Methylocaldum sp. TaxID=1969727 RepID=UPI002D66175C|nr:VPLPA-CTERM sorting domain-containing protein [Methylocaldum sp.]HYE34160.1 VPLPA-CTERM sorting domain-containing protein [Methylocaldum sp.]